MTLTMKMLPYKQANAKIRIYAADIYLFKANNKSLKQGVYTVLSYQKRHQDDLIDIGTLRNIDITLMSLLLTLKRFHTFSQYFIVAFGESCWLGLPAGIKAQKNKRYGTGKDRCKLCHTNQMDQTPTRKESCILFKKYAKCRL